MAQQDGVTLESFIMKKTSLKNLKISSTETKRVHSAAARQKNVKITININSDTLKKVRSLANKSGVPYQRLINRMLRETLDHTETTESRLERLEKELRQLKLKLAA